MEKFRIKTLKILDTNMTKLYNEINKADANVTKSNVISWYAVCVTANIATPEQNPTKKGGP